MKKKLTKWTPTTNLKTLRRAGKMQEELGELQAVVARLIIQGINEIDPGSGKVNKLRLEEEIADVIAQVGLAMTDFDLDTEFIEKRVADKIEQMKEWEDMFNEEPKT